MTNGDHFSNLFSWQLSNATLDGAADGIIVSGYANETDIPSLPFVAGNITLVSVS